MSSQLREVWVNADELENAITDACAQLSMATDTEAQRLIFMRVQVLHGMRTPEQVRRLEEHRGLRMADSLDHVRVLGEE